MDREIVNNSLLYEYAENAFIPIEQICYPLNTYLGIKYFCYAKIYSNGEYFSISNNLKWEKFYLNNVHSENIIFEGGTQLSTFAKNNAPIPLLWPENPTSLLSKQLVEHDIWNGIDFIIFNEKYTEYWMFAGNKDDNNLRPFYLNKTDILYKFIAYFNDKAKQYIKPKMEPRAIHKNGVNYPKSWPPIPSEVENEFLKEIRSYKNYLTFDNYPFKKLTSQEIVCLSNLSKGKSIKEIGNDIGISTRTVEVHINNIKVKTGYTLKSNLIKLYNDFYFEI